MALIETLQDNFDNNSIDFTLWETDGLVAESGQQLNLSVAATDRAVEILSVDTYDFSSSSISVEVVGHNATGRSDYRIFPLYLNDNNFSSVRFVFTGNKIASEMNVVGEPFYTLDEVTYNPTTHRFLRLRQDYSHIFWETSENGTSWTEFSMGVVGGFLPEEVRFRAFGNFIGLNTGVVTISLDNINITAPTGRGSSTSSLVSSAVGTLNYSAYGSSTSSLISSATGIIFTPTTEIEKEYIIKVYSSDGSYIGIWRDVLNDLTYHQNLNDGGAAAQFRLGRSARNFVEVRENLETEAGDVLETEDNKPLEAVLNQFKTIGEGTDVDLNYNVDIYLYEGLVEPLETEDGEIIETEDGKPLEATIGSPDGRRVFSGWLSKYRAHYGTKEYVDVFLLHHSTELDNYIANDEGDTTFTINSTDPSTMLTTILDQYIADGGTLTYDSASIQLTGTVASYTFKMMTVRQAIDKILELSPPDFYWYIDVGNNVINFKQKADTPKHTFIFQKHIKEIDVERHLEDLVNEVRFVGGGDPQLYKLYEDSTSKTAWRQGLEILTDSRVTTAASAEILSESLIDRYKDPVYATEVTILDAQYRTERIQLGDTVSFANFGNFIDSLNLLIVGLDYNKNFMRLQLGTLLPKTNKRLEEVKRNLLQEEVRGVTDAPV